MGSLPEYGTKLCMASLTESHEAPMRVLQGRYIIAIESMLGTFYCCQGTSIARLSGCA